MDNALDEGCFSIRSPLAGNKYHVGPSHRKAYTTLTGKELRMNSMDRRTLLKTGGAAVIGLGFGGCSTRKAVQTVPATPPPQRLVNLVPIDASWERVIHTTVGLRPHRPNGFVLRAEKLDAKMLVHNYGHGGTGLSISWGTGSMAADMALAQEGRRAAVIGCGAVGLTTARELQRRGFDVTIYAMTLPPHVTSNYAFGGFTPTSGLISGERTPEFDAQFRQAAEISYRQLHVLNGSNHGVSWINSYSTTDSPPGQPRPAGSGGEGGGASDANPLLPPALQPGRGPVLGPGEHPFPTKYATVRPYIRIEPSLYLDALMRDVVLFGGRIVVRKFDTPRDLMSLSEPVIVNCTGLGSRDLFGDTELMPIKGQIVLLVPQPDVNYTASGAMPRNDGIALGHVNANNVWTLEPIEEERKRVVEGCIKFFSAMRPPVAGATLTRAETPSQVPTLESFFGEQE
jgi:glycine/D-amino acid oxidase-like deaminating enzyme